jgi:hypothetical protein
MVLELVHEAKRIRRIYYLHFYKPSSRKCQQKGEIDISCCILQLIYSKFFLPSHWVAQYNEIEELAAIF